LGQLALRLWPKLLAGLPEPVFFQQNGSLVLAFAADRSHFDTLRGQLKGNAPEDYQTLDAAAILKLEPELNARFAHGLFLPNEGQLDNRQLLRVLAGALRSRSQVQWHTSAYAQLEDQQLLVNGEPVLEHDWVIDCRGIGAKETQADLRGVRGEVIRVRAPAVNLNRPVRLVHPRYPLYIAPKPEHTFVIGATQIESEDRRAPTVRSALELLSACFSVHSGFAEAEILEIRSGLRPAYRNNHPQMRVKGRVISLNGLFRHGYLLSPVMVDLCRSFLLQQPIDGRYLAAMPSLLLVEPEPLAKERVG
ncbi:MAG: FAD-dependent oxidoreductase, partial [Clostridia bacterium]|nr:FAD-dependent oxidoreductase [Clostridia bacterium]